MIDKRDLNKLTHRKNWFAFIFLSFFLFKFNYLLLVIINIPSPGGVIIKNLIFIAFFALILPHIVETKRGRLLILIFTLIFTTLFMANYWYNNYFGDYLSINDMILSEGTGNFSFITVLIRHIINPYDFIFILDILLMGLLLPDRETVSNLLNTSKTISTDIRYRNSKSRKSMFTSIIILILIVSQIVFVGYKSDSRNPVEIYKENTTEFVNIYGIIPLYVMETYELLSPAIFYTVEAETTGSDSDDTVDSSITTDLDITIDSDTITDPGTEATGINENLIIESQINTLDERPNIIVIQMESFDARLINYEYRGKEITPFINNLTKKSIYFNNFYAQHVNGSFDADFSFLTSLYPINRKYVFRENDFSEIPSLAKTLNRYGYQSYAFHGYLKEFFNRNKAYPDLGFDRFYSRENYSEDNTVMKVENHKLGLNDYDFFKQSLDMLEDKEEPFFAYFISLTSHTPFHFYPESEAQEEYSSIEDTLVSDYFNSTSFLDKSLQMFFNGLEERGMTDNTLFVIYGDHQSDIDSIIYSSDRNFNLDNKVKTPESVPLIIYHNALEGKKIDLAGNFTDIAPTILDIIEAKDIPDTFLGRSLLSDKEKPIPFLHENPLIIYRDNLFLMQNNKFEKAGYIDGTGNRDIELSKSMKVDIRDTINKNQNIIFNTKEY